MTFRISKQEVQSWFRDKREFEQPNWRIIAYWENDCYIVTIKPHELYEVRAVFVPLLQQWFRSKDSMGVWPRVIADQVRSGEILDLREMIALARNGVPGLLAERMLA